MSFKNKHLSYSRISRYESCPLSFKLRYIDGHEAKGTAATQFGSLIHSVLENLIREVIDYKTNRLLFTREEIDNSLQMSLYHLAARKLWPWAKNVRLTFHMLRHGINMRTERTPEQVESALTYVESIGRQTEETTDFPPRLNSYCIYCDHRDACQADTDALKGKQNVACEDMDDLEVVAREREEVANLTKILYARKSDLEKIIKSHLDANEDLVLGGVRYRMFNMTRYSYPVEETVSMLSRASGLPADELRDRLTTIDNKSLDKLLKDIGKTLDRARVRMLKAELEAKAEASHSQRLWAKGV